MTSSLAVPCCCRPYASSRGPWKWSVPLLALYDFFSFTVCVSRTLLQGLLGKWARALSYRQKVFTSLEGPVYAAATLPPIRRCQASRSLLGKLLLCGIPIYEQKPANNSTLRMHLRGALTAMLCPSHGKPGWRCTPGQGEKRKRARKSEAPPNSMQPLPRLLGG